MVDNRDALHPREPNLRYRLAAGVRSTSQRRAQGARPGSRALAGRLPRAGRRGRGRAAPARHVLPRPQRAAEAARGGAGRRGADPVRPARRGGRAREPLPAHARSTDPDDAARLARRRARHARGRRQGAPPAAVGGRAHPPRHGRGARLVRRARGRRARRSPTCRPSARRSRACSDALGIERGPHRLLLGPPARRRRADRRRARGDGPRARAVLALPRRRRAARRGRLDPRRRERRERGLPAGAVRRGVGDRRARGGRAHARARGGGDRRLATTICVPCGGCRQRLREFMPLDGTIHLCSADGERRTVTLEELLPMSFGPEFLPA